jgi:hypothetical protein
MDILMDIFGGPPEVRRRIRPARWVALGAEHARCRLGDGDRLPGERCSEHLVPGGRTVINKLAARAAVAAFALSVIVSISTASTASATPSIPIPPPVAGPGLHGR